MQFFFDKDGDGTISFAEFCRFVGVDVSNEKYAKDIETDDAKLAAARDEVDRNSGPVRKMRRSLLDKTRNSLTRRRENSMLKRQNSFLRGKRDRDKSIEVAVEELDNKWWNKFKIENFTRQNLAEALFVGSLFFVGFLQLLPFAFTYKTCASVRKSSGILAIACVVYVAVMFALHKWHDRLREIDKAEAAAIKVKAKRLEAVKEAEADRRFIFNRHRFIFMGVFLADALVFVTPVLWNANIVVELDSGIIEKSILAGDSPGAAAQTATAFDAGLWLEGAFYNSLADEALLKEYKQTYIYSRRKEDVAPSPGGDRRPAGMSASLLAGWSKDIKLDLYRKRQPGEPKKANYFPKHNKADMKKTDVGWEFDNATLSELPTCILHVPPGYLSSFRSVTELPFLDWVERGYVSTTYYYYLRPSIAAAQYYYTQSKTAPSLLSPHAFSSGTPWRASSTPRRRTGTIFPTSSRTSRKRTRGSRRTPTSSA